jgi:AAA family ATP:ADP antiporter
MSKSGHTEFHPWRSFLWPVHTYELKKFIPMLLIFFLLFFSYNILRNLKDTLVVTAEASGAEVIPFIKVWVMFPGAILLTFIFTRLSNRFSSERVFYIMVTLFLAYFLLFTLVLYPARSYLHPDSFADSLQHVLPEGFKGLIAMFRNWTLTSFYVMSELWSNIILSMLFWGFANQITHIGEAKRFYGLFGIGANFSGVAAGQASVFLCNHTYNSALPFGTNAWEQSLFMLVALVLISGTIAIIAFRWMHLYVIPDTQSLHSSTLCEKESEKSERLSMRESFAYLMRSKYLIGIAIIVISYNLVINLVEVVWKHEVNALFPNPSDYNIYMNQVTTFIGILATLTSLFISGNAIRQFGWTFTALLTPMILLLTSIGFFTFFFLKPYLSDSALPLLGATPLALVVFFGSAQNIISRAAKYTVFDATKEMAFVPLSTESKRKGKAVIDGVASRLGKSGGSLIHQSLLVTFSTITASAPYVAGFLLAVIFIWTMAARVLGKQFVDITKRPVSEPLVRPLEPLLAPNR